ncbi:MAG TPA: alpha/beta fold hydrolase [Nitrospiraceae bacterium]|nr:alpha/beta fold hydrolase [Nitrospiraceae bacterium]
MNQPTLILTLWPLLALCLLSSCSSPQIPQWFEAFSRMPVRTVEVDGHRLAYLDQGTGPVLILIHGFGGSLWQWEYQQVLSQHGYRVITVDLLGSGFSDKPALEYRPEEVLRFFLGFMDRLAVPKATLIGNSMGAGVAIAAALTAPERVERLVLIGGLPADIKGHLASPLVRKGLDSSVPAWLAELGAKLFGSSVGERVLREIIYDQSMITHAVLDRSGRNRRQPGLIGPMLAIGKTLPEWESQYAPRLSEIRQPTLIIWGQEDRIFPPAVGRTLSETITGSRLMLVPRAGHIPQWEQPETVNHAIRAFLKS